MADNKTNYAEVLHLYPDEVGLDRVVKDAESGNRDAQKHLKAKIRSAKVSGKADQLSNDQSADRKAERQAGVS